MKAPFRWIALLTLLFLGIAGTIGQASAKVSQLGPKTNYTAQQIADAVARSNLDPSLRAYANQMGQLGVYESSGNAGIYNGSCCTGIFQLNQGNLRANGLTPQQYANMSLDQQVAVWAKVTNGGVNTGVVRKLQEMKTFDGQPVDGAMIMACIQLGTGNCQKMVQSGKCTGFSDINGTTICKMANAMRGKTDPSKGVSDPFENIPGDVQNPDLFTKADLQIQECWSCEAAARVIEVTSQIGPLLVNKLGSSAAKLMAIIFMTVFCVLVATRIFWISSAGGWNDLFWLVLRFAFVITLIGGGTLYTEIVRPYILVPSIAIGGQVGTKLSVIGNQALHNNPSKGVCRYDRIQGTDQELIKAGESVINLVCAVHLTVNEAITKAAMPASQIKAEDSSNRSNAVIAVLSVLSMFVQATFWLALLLFAFQIVEALIRMGFFVAFAPFLAYAWVYKTTQNTFNNAIKGFFYGSVLLIMSGMMSAVTLFILSTGMNKAGNPTTLGISLDLIGETVYFLIYSFASASIAASLMRSAPSLAAAITNYSGATGEGSFASAGISGIFHGVKVVTSGAGYFALGTGNLAGNALGKHLPGLAKNVKDLALKSLPGGIKLPGGTSAVQTIKALSPSP